MPNEHPTDIRIAGEQPPIPVVTAGKTPFKLNEKGGSVTQISGVK
jgi:hypothetical protein